MRLRIGTSWKMNLTSTEAARYLDDLLPLVADIEDRELFVLAPFTSLWIARDKLAASALHWGAQDVHHEDRGAHTGDVSAPMLADLGCTYVEVGHWERRRDHGETDELVAAKVAATQRWAMTAIVCVGEDGPLALDDVRARIMGQLDLLAACDPGRLIVAYEPAWAIGTGASAAPPDWVAEVLGAVRCEVVALWPGVPVPLIYGGSVDEEGARSLLGRPEVDGLFVGRQALDPHVFARIAHAVPGGPG